MTALVIDVPLAELPPSPNKQRSMHWVVKARLTKVARDMAWACGFASPHKPRVCQEPQLVRAEIIYPTSRKGPMTDPDSALARLKPLIDGLVDAGCLRGDGPTDVQYAPVEQRKEGSKLIVRFTLTPLASLDQENR